MHFHAYMQPITAFSVWKLWNIRVSRLENNFIEKISGPTLYKDNAGMNL